MTKDVKLVLDEASMTYRIRKAQQPEIDKMIKSAGMMKLQIQSSIGDFVKMQKGGDVEITVSGTAKNLSKFDAVVRGKSSYGDPSLLKKEEVELSEKEAAYPATVDTLKQIVKDKQHQTVMFDKGSAKVDLFTASAMLTVYKALKQPHLKKKFEDMIKSKEGFMQTQAFAMKVTK